MRGKSEKSRAYGGLLGAPEAEQALVIDHEVWLVGLPYVTWFESCFCTNDLRKKTSRFIVIGFINIVI